MTGRTHLLVGLASGLLVGHVAGVQGLYLIPCVMTGGIGGLVPDIDHPRSMLSGWLPGSGLIRLFVRHRGPTHSILGLMLFLSGMAAVLSLGVPFTDPVVLRHTHIASIAVGVGYALHLLCDMATPEGIPLFMPVYWRYFRLAPRLILSWSSWMLESIVTVGALVLVGAVVIGVL